MTQFNLATPSPPIALDRFADARRTAMQPTSWLGAVGDAIGSEWSAGWVGRFVSRMGMEDDPDFHFTRETFDELMVGLPADMGEEFADARSAAHAGKIREQMLGVAQSRERLAARGWSGQGLRMLAAMTDPADILAGAAASAAFGPEAGVPLAAAKKSARIARMIRAGMVGVAGAIPNQLVLSELDPQQDWKDVLFTASGGFIGGNLSSAFQAPPATKLASMGRAAGVGAVTGATVSTGAQLALQGDVDIGQVATAALFGGTGAGVLGVASSGDRTLDQRLSDAYHRQRTGIEFNDVLEGAMGASSARELRGKTFRELVKDGILTERGRIAFATDLDPLVRADAVNRLVDEAGFHPTEDAATIARLKQMDPDDLLAELHSKMQVDGIMVRGAATTVSSGRRSSSARYAIVEADDLSPSHDPRRRSPEGGFARNAGGDESARPFHDPVQGKQAIDDVLRVARTPRPEFVLRDTSSPDDGPPVVDADGNVAAGQVRTMGLQLAYLDDAKAATIKAAVADAAERFGLSRAQAEAMDRPLVVRVLDDVGSFQRTAEPAGDGINGPTIARAGEGVDGEPGDIDEFGTIDDQTNGANPGEIPSARGGGISPPLAPSSTLPPKQPGDFDLSWIPSALPGMRYVRVSFSSILGMSPAIDNRRAAAAYADDAMLRKDGTSQRMPATTWVTREARRHVGAWQREHNAAFSDWITRRGTPLGQRGAERNNFGEEVGKAIRMPRGTYSDPAINRSADAARKTLQTVLETTKRHRANGFETIEPREDYFPRHWRHRSLNQATATYGDENVHRLFERAVADGGLIEAENVPRFARVLVKALRDLDRWTDTDKAMLVDGRPDVLRELLVEDKWSPDEIEDALRAVLPKPDTDRASSPRAKRRVVLDEQAAIETPQGTFRIDDLLDNNVERVLPNYVRHMSGASAVAEVYRTVGGEDVVTWDQFKNRLGTRANKLKVPAEKITSDLKNLEILDRTVRGFPIGNDSFWTRLGRRLRGYNYVRLSGQFGFAQLPEVVAMIGDAGIKTMWAQMPAFRQVWSRAADGKLSNELLATVESVWGLGTDRLLNRFHDRLDDASGVVEHVGGRLDAAIHKGMKIAGDVSGMSAINMASQRIAAVAAIQKWWGYAQSDRLPSEKRLASMGGLNADMAKRITAAMRAEAKAERGVTMVDGPLFGRRVANIDFSKWADQDAASWLIDAVDKWSRRVIQENDIGNMPPWVVNDLGRVILQFRSFTIAAWEKNLLFRLQMRDWEAGSGAMLGMLGAGLVYVGQTYAQSIGRDDREEFLRKRLAFGSIGAASFQRGAFSSLLPSFIDQGLVLAGEDPIFNYRQTGLSTPVFSIDSSPSVQLVGRDLTRAAGGVLSSMAKDDRVFDQRDANAATNLLPFSQAVGIRNFLRMFAQQFPEDDR